MAARRPRKFRNGFYKSPSDPAGGGEGDFYFNTTTKTPRYHNGTAWVEFNMGEKYTTAEYLDNQTSDGTIKTFSFLNGDVYKVWVEFTMPDQTALADGTCTADGSDPTSAHGTPLHNAQTQPISVKTSTVKVLAPNGATIKVYGYR